MNSMKVVAMMALCGCAGVAREAREPRVERLDGQGVSAPMLMVEAGRVLRFVNADARPHQIYSNDCTELSSTVLSPGDTYDTTLGAGPKVCHFEDLLAPLAAGYSGTLQIQSAEEDRSTGGVTPLP
jgi:hypothetical protein